MKRLYFYLLCSISFITLFMSVCHLWANAPTHPKIVFNSNRDGNTEIYVMDTDGSQQIRLTKHPDADFQPMWSPTGEQILFVSNRDGVDDLYLMDANGENVRRVFQKIASREQPAWSPDGKQIAYLGNKGNDWAIYIATLDGREERLATCSRSGGFPAWSPDGTEIAFPKAGLIERPNPLVIINLHTRRQEILQPEPQLHMFRPAWSLDGTTIAFSHIEKLDGKGPVTGTIYTVRRDGTNLREIIPEQEQISEHPAWSPSGEELAYHRKVDGNRQIFKIDLASRQNKQLTSRGINVYPDWFDPAFALPVSPKRQLLTIIWAKMKTSKSMVPTN